MRLLLLLTALFALSLLPSCGDDSNAQALEDCQVYCQRIQECDETNVVTDELVTSCLDLCDQASEGTVEYTIEADVARCSRFTNCTDFNDCVLDN